MGDAVIELVLMACLIDKPDSCRDVSLNISSTMTPMQCIQESQGEAIKWLATHPGYLVAKLTCGRLGRYAKI